jgi:hypothetical protein
MAKWEKPVILDMDALPRALGQCMEGSTPVSGDNTCTTGGAAYGGCGSGSITTVGCVDGGKASGCGSGSAENM